MEPKNTKTKRTAKTAKPKTPIARNTPVRTRALAPANSPLAEYIEPTSDEEVARLAYALWEERGKPIGSPDADWYEAKAQLSSILKEVQSPRQSA